MAPFDAPPAYPAYQVVYELQDGLKAVEEARKLRISELEREAAEFRLEYILTHASASASHKERVRVYAELDTNVSGDAYKVLSYCLRMANKDGTNFYQTPERVAATLGIHPKKVQRAFAILEKQGYCEKRRRRNDVSDRKFVVPDKVRQTVEELKFLLSMASAERTNLSFHSYSARKDKNGVEKGQICPTTSSPTSRRSDNQEEGYRSRRGEVGHTSKAKKSEVQS